MALCERPSRGIACVAADFLLNLIACDLVRIPKLLAALRLRPSETPRTAQLAAPSRKSPEMYPDVEVF
jgi:hypothetical protein